MAAVGGVEGVEEPPLGVGEGELGGGRASVHAEEDRSQGGGETGPRQGARAVPCLELGPLGGRGEECRHAWRLEWRMGTQGAPGELGQADRWIGGGGIRVEGRAEGDEEPAVLGNEALLGAKAEGLSETPPELGQEVQGAANEGYPPLDRPPAGQARDGLF